MFLHLNMLTPNWYVSPRIQKLYEIMEEAGMTDLPDIYPDEYIQGPYTTEYAYPSSYDCHPL